MELFIGLNILWYVILFVVFILFIATYIAAIIFLYRLAKQKANYPHGNGFLVLMAIFLSPIFLALYILVASLSNKDTSSKNASDFDSEFSPGSSSKNNKNASDFDSELPPI
jgi:ABC-type multidrug transport system permease subunit